MNINLLLLTVASILGVFYSVSGDRNEVALQFSSQNEFLEKKFECLFQSENSDPYKRPEICDVWEAQLRAIIAAYNELEGSDNEVLRQELYEAGDKIYGDMKSNHCFQC